MAEQKPTEPVLSKNLAFGSIALIVVLGVVGVIFLHLFRPDASATFIQTIVTFAGILTVAITTIYGLGKLGDRVEVVQRQTNGTLSALREENDRLTRELGAIARSAPSGEAPAPR
ncbi:hypothetical protein [uncultured Microbacterium sp.]|uniref:hypothetical protein n=1 Tax=uncultured Microbacterium sp. TaxID=191216 RepID=UPI0025E012D2|nr:hypothetical protein [uncultured Microbacterium sp.]